MSLQNMDSYGFHNFRSFRALSNVCPLTIASNPCFAIYLHMFIREIACHFSLSYLSSVCQILQDFSLSVCPVSLMAFIMSTLVSSFNVKKLKKKKFDAQNIKLTTQIIADSESPLIDLEIRIAFYM